MSDAISKRFILPHSIAQSIILKAERENIVANKPEHGGKKKLQPKQNDFLRTVKNNSNIAIKILGII